MKAAQSILALSIAATLTLAGPTRQFILDLHHELIVDNFAGGGGASVGIERALGRHVDHAINHAFDALGMHRINHPQSIHHCEDVFDIDPEKICEGRPVGLGHFSPDCKHFSKAKGGQPLNKRIRGLVLIMLKWAKYGARVMTMENVEEITTWGPLNAEGRPDKDQLGRTWDAFLSCISTGIDPDHPDLPMILETLDGYVTREECVRGFGYAYQAQTIRACDFGTPTIRKRLFGIFRRDGRPIVWPKATHAAPDTIAQGSKLQPYRTIAECIDWHLPCPSIFLTGAEAKRWRCKRPLAASSLRRIAKGVDRHVLRAKKAFLVSLTHQGGERVESIDEPSRTITGAHRGEKAIVQPAFLTEHANGSTQRVFPADEPLRTQCAEVKGGHFALVAGTLIQNGYGEREGQEPRIIDPNAPGLTAVASGVKQAVVTANLVTNTTGHAGADLNNPCPTIATGGHHAVVTGTLIHTAHGEQDKNGKKRGRGDHALTESMPTVTASRDCALSAASLVKLRGDVDSHGLQPDLLEPGHTISAGGTHHGLIAASLTKFNSGSVGQSADEPITTIPACSHRPETRGGAATPHGLLAAYLAQHNGGFNETVGHDATEPLSTISSKGSQQQVVAASLQTYYGSDQDPRMDHPSHTVTTKDRFGLLESRAVNPPMTDEQIAGAHRVAAFLRAHGVQFEGEFATVEGYVIVDLGMRMLTPRELFRAQGFGEDYIIDRAWVIDKHTGELTEVLLTKEQQIRMCGNSVCPQVMESLIRANCPDLIVREHYAS